jgi:hypothetical protein
MKKNFFYFAMALCVALCTVSCGSDDDSDDGVPHYTKQKYETEAAAYDIVPRTAVSSTPSAEGEEVSITGIDFTESGKAIFELTFESPNGKKTLQYVTYDVEINGDTYTVKDGSKTIGTVVKKGSRASSEGVMITINVSLTVGGKTYPFSFDDPVAAVQLLEVMAASKGLTDITRTWQVESMMLVLRFDNGNSPSVRVTGGKLTNFQILAEDNGIILKEKDRTALNRTIQGITLDKYGLFTVTYSDKYNDAATWSWVAGSNDGKINLILKDEAMGNKFLENSTDIEVQYTGDDKINLVLTTRLEADECTAYITMNLK